jgi:hypothetical protein
MFELQSYISSKEVGRWSWMIIKEGFERCGHCIPRNCPGIRLTRWSKRLNTQSRQPVTRPIFETGILGNIAGTCYWNADPSRQIPQIRSRLLPNTSFPFHHSSLNLSIEAKSELLKASLSKPSGKFLTGWMAVCFSKTLLHEVVYLFSCKNCGHRKKSHGWWGMSAVEASQPLHTYCCIPGLIMLTSPQPLSLAKIIIWLSLLPNKC